MTTPRYNIAGFLHGYRVVGNGTWYGDFDRIAEASAACDLLNSGWVGSNIELRHALAAGTQSAETNEDLAQSEGCQSGGDSRNAQTPSPQPFRKGR